MLKLDEINDDGWTYFEDTGLYYRYFPSESSSWTDARSVCNEQGQDGELASANSSAINTFVSSLAPGDAWLGGYQEEALPWELGTEDPSPQWKWSDGSVWGFEN